MKALSATLVRVLDKERKERVIRPAAGRSVDTAPHG
jgi:hypothetical protein